MNYAVVMAAAVEDQNMGEGIKLRRKYNYTITRHTLHRSRDGKGENITLNKYIPFECDENEDETLLMLLTSQSERM